MSERFRPETHNGPSEIVHEQALEMIEEGGFRVTSMPFNIGRSEGRFERGFDLFQPATEERLYITDETPGDTEQVLTKLLGKHAVLQQLPDYKVPGVSIYEVPKGSRLLSKTLKVQPFNPDYMQQLAGRALNLMDNLHKLDPKGFGVTLDQLAITHNGGHTDDDTYLTIVPPTLTLREDFDRSPNSLKDLAKQLRVAERIGPVASRNALRDLQKDKKLAALDTTDRLVQFREWMREDDYRLINAQFAKGKENR